MKHADRPGFYVDAEGNSLPDRRSGPDRRDLGGDHATHERRGLFRRKADRELLERDHKVMIKEALEDFAEEHGGEL